MVAKCMYASIITPGLPYNSMHFGHLATYPETLYN